MKAFALALVVAMTPSLTEKARADRIGRLTAEDGWLTLVGLFLPAGSPPDAVAKIHVDTKKILEDPEFRQKQLIDKGYDVVGSSPAEFAAYIRKDSESRGRAVKISGSNAE